MALKDEALARKAGEGDVDAFEALYDRHHRGVHALCRHLLGSPDEADDAVQHTFGVVFRELSGGTRPEHPRPWIYAIARNRALDRAARAARRSRANTGAVDRRAFGGGRAPGGPARPGVRHRPAARGAAQCPHTVRARRHAACGGGQCARMPERPRRALVYQARSTLGGWREARERSCLEVRSQIVESRGGALRRGPLQRHLQVCAECAAFRDREVEQRRSLALVLPVPAAPWLKEAVLDGAVASAATGGGAAAGGGGAGSLGAGALKIGAAAVVLGGAGLGVVGFTGDEGSGDRTEPPPPAENASAEPEPRQSGSGASGARRNVQRREAERRARVERSGGGRSRLAGRDVGRRLEPAGLRSAGPGARARCAVGAGAGAEFGRQRTELGFGQR